MSNPGETMAKCMAIEHDQFLTKLSNKPNIIEGNCDPMLIKLAALAIIWRNINDINR